MVWRSQCGEDTGEELQTHLDLSAVAIPAQETREGGGSHVNTHRESSQTIQTNLGPTDSQCKLVPVFPDFLDVVLQVVEEQFHHVQFLLGPPEGADERSQDRECDA